ncbi:MAG: hypothetical protein QG641_725, partial [Candidatus Poribacteria bacterium]|nr:hypothetical protein [Candidatus Poribacteria bacterium]
MSDVKLGIKGTVFFVSTDGNDAWSGKLASPNKEKSDGPFATIAKARDEIRKLKPLSEPANVMLRGGTYFLDEPIIFNQRDSGTKECPINYMAYPGENPVISGGKKLIKFPVFDITDHDFVFICFPFSSYLFTTTDDG